MNELTITAAQARAIAELVEASEPSVVNGITEERPCSISVSSPGYLRVQIGIFGSKAYLIDRAGEQLAELV